ncbi:zinc-ribbon domain containing protein [Blastopirellula retiformator]|uniref:Probable zinc-binding domain-containing protein n=1 Tax=Blastopirellula retiformator TaxID=2527970 RepID=A0A5C5VJ36_9BACT|nr:zinc-ribbon domain containing protein [Blastopirellula retiformator]TWT38606.1 hypothetical protein Enr8_02990 [Blastopirellula retiformator]
MKSNRQKKAQLKAKRARKAQRAHYAAILRGEIRPLNSTATCKPGNLPCDRSQLAYFNSYGEPDFVADGYQDREFRCIDCGAEETWKAAAQKWWYEVAKGSVWSYANRCRTCRRRRRAIRAEANDRCLAGIERKRQSKRLPPSSQKRKLR